MKNDGHFRFPHPQICLKQFSNICKKCSLFFYYVAGWKMIKDFHKKIKFKKKFKMVILVSFTKNIFIMYLWLQILVCLFLQEKMSIAWKWNTIQVPDGMTGHAQICMIMPVNLDAIKSLYVYNNRINKLRTILKQAEISLFRQYSNYTYTFRIVNLHCKGFILCSIIGEYGQSITY